MSTAKDGPVSSTEKGTDPSAEHENTDALSLDEMEYATGWRFFAVSIAIVLSIFLASLDLTIISTTIPHITDEFHSLDQVGWYASALFLTVAATQGMWGKAFKYFPIKPVYLISIFIFEVGSLICGVAPNSTTFIVGRAITGFGVAGSFAGAYIIIGVTAPANQRPALTGLLGMAYTIAFYINLPCGALAALSVILSLRVPKAAKPAKASWKEKILQMDFIGVVTVCGAVVCYLLALQWGGVSKPWNSSGVVGTLVGCIVLTAAFIFNEWWQGERALLVPSVLQNRTIASGCAFVFCIAGNFYILLYYIPIYFQAVRGTNAQESGIRTLPLILGLTLMQIVIGIAIGAVGIFNPFLILGGVISTIGSALLFTLKVDSSHSIWIGYQALAGIELGICFTVPIIVTQSISKPADIAPATSVVLFFQSLGGALIVTAGQSIFENGLLNALPNTAPGVDPQAVLLVGASNIPKSFPNSELPGIDAAYMKGIQNAFILAISCAAIATIVGISQPWFRIQMNKKPEVQIDGNPT